MTTETTTTTQRLCKGPLHNKNGEGTMIPSDSFASERSHWCRRCQSDYDQRRGSARGASRASRKEQKHNNNNHEGEPPQVMSVSRSSQNELELKGKGVERVSIAAVNTAVSKYVDARDARMAKTKKEVEAKTALCDVLKKNKEKIGCDAEGTIIYRHDDLIVTLKHGKDDVKVRTEDAENGD